MMKSRRREQENSKTSITDVDTESDDHIQQQQQAGHYQQSSFRKMPVESSIENEDNSTSTTTTDCCLGTVHSIETVLGKTPIVLVSVIMFAIFCAAGISICWFKAQAKEDGIEEEALRLAIETGEWISDQLDQAILPLFSMAQFVTHLGIFHDLPDRIGVAGEAGSLPMIMHGDGRSSSHRNVTGVCDDPELVNTFTSIASGVKKNAKMEGILVNIQLAPEGVVCLLHPMNNTEDIEDGKFLDSTGARGLDLFSDPFMKYIALGSIVKESVGVAGPLPLTQCPTCGNFFIARLPIVDESHQIVVDGQAYNRWGFATALIAWNTLVNRSGIYESFADSHFEFQLTRTDLFLNEITGLYEENVVLLAETPSYIPEEIYGRHWRYVSTTLETTDNQWEMTVQYDHSDITRWMWILSATCVVTSFFISYLVYTVLLQKQMQSNMVASTLAQEARVATERNMTAYFAHELRNPLSALDSALQTMAEEQLPTSTKELIDGMQLCSSFMSSIMNNLLDVRKIEEGKMSVRAHPVKLTNMIDETRRMMIASTRPGVELLTDKRVPKGRNWVLGDKHRIQQVLTNMVSNAVKYTLEGSITLTVSWKDDFVQLECIDTGPGIPTGEQAKLFERFVQRGGAPGTGLGLYIAKEIVNMMGGSICFESDPTVKPGTTCRILLPLELCEQAEDETKKPVELIRIEEPIDILIIDDIKMNRSMLQRRIEKAIAPNASIVMAETGEEALKICKEKPFDIVICDQYMEETGGVLLGTDVIVAMRRNKSNSFIIGCSGNDLHQKFFEAGADMVWGKPMPSNAAIIQQWREGLKERKCIVPVQTGSATRL